MDDMTITLTIPAELAREAQDEGLLTSERVSELLKDELKRAKAASRLAANLDKLRAASTDLTREDLENELRDYYAGN